MRKYLIFTASLFCCLILTIIPACKQNQNGIVDINKGVRSNIPDNSIAIINSSGFQKAVAKVMKELYTDLFENICQGNIPVAVSHLTMEAFSSLHTDIRYNYNDTIFHIVNFGNSNGFVVYSDNYGIIALTDNGHFDISTMIHPRSVSTDTGFSPMDEIYSLVDMQAYYLIEKGLFLTHLGAQSYLDTCGNFLDTIVDTCCLFESIRPKVPINPGQGDPLNRYVPTDSYGHHYNAGCGPIALTMLFSAKQYPSEIRSVEGDWEQIINDFNEYLWTNSANVDILARWVDKIGNITCAQYYNAGTWILPIAIKTAMDCYPRYRRIQPQLFDYHDQNRIIHNLICSNPVIMFSSTQSLYSIEDIENDLSNIFNDFADFCANGHYFVIDGLGYVSSRHNIIYENCNCGIDTTFTYQYPLLHCNFGWDGYCNGYYRYEKSIDLSHGPEYTSEFANDLTSSFNALYNRGRLVYYYEYN